MRGFGVSGLLKLITSCVLRCITVLIRDTSMSLDYMQNGLLQSYMILKEIDFKFTVEKYTFN